MKIATLSPERNSTNITTPPYAYNQIFFGKYTSQNLEIVPSCIETEESGSSKICFL